MKMIKRAKDHVSAAFHSAPFQGQPPTGGTQRQTERAIYANVEEAETCERKHTYNARNRLMHPKVGGAKGLGLCFCFCQSLGPVIIFVTHIAIRRLLSSLSALLSQKTTLLPCVSSASSFSTAA